MNAYWADDKILFRTRGTSFIKKILSLPLLTNILKTRNVSIFISREKLTVWSVTRDQASCTNILTIFFSTEEDSDELSDNDINKLLIVTQTTSRVPKHDGYDRTGDRTTRVKITQELEQAINDGLYYYEEDLWHSVREVKFFINAFVSFVY